MEGGSSSTRGPPPTGTTPSTSSTPTGGGEGASLQSDAREVYMLAIDNGYRVTSGMLSARGWTNQRIARTLNAFSEKRLCKVTKSGSEQELVARFREASIASKLNELSVNEYKVYGLIEDSGNKGIWTADIRKAGGLPTHEIQRAVKLLCDEVGLIKQVKNVYATNRKLYMLANLEPSKEIAGGVFYKDSKFDEELVNKLRDRAVFLLKGGQQSTLEDVCTYIKSAGLGRDISQDEIGLILKTLQLEHKVIEIIDEGSGTVMYKWCRWPQLNTSLCTTLPCLSCPVFNQCNYSTGSSISPATCPYFDVWVSSNHQDDGHNDDGEDFT